MSRTIQRPTRIPTRRTALSSAVACLLGLVGADAHADAVCTNVDSGLTPIDELQGEYVGFGGHAYGPGLYGTFGNERTPAHLAAGLQRALEAAVPRRADGSVCDGEDPGPDCQVAFVSVGMSNTTQEWSGGGPNAIDPALGFVAKAQDDADRNPHLAFCDLARGGTQAQCQSGDDPDCLDLFDNFWNESVPTRLADAQVSAQQVTAAWVKVANHDETNPDHVAYLEQNVVHILEIMQQTFPNLRVVYLNSRIYGGYAPAGNNEPFAYEHGIAMRNIIERQMSGDPALCFDPDACAEPAVPWVDWGAYMWANGPTKNSVGLSWLCSDFREDDGQHPSADGVDKVSGYLLSYLKDDPTAQQWFLAEPPVPGGDDDGDGDADGGESDDGGSGSSDDGVADGGDTGDGDGGGATDGAGSDDDGVAGGSGDESGPGADADASQDEGCSCRSSGWQSTPGVALGLLLLFVGRRQRSSEVVPPKGR